METNSRAAVFYIEPLESRIAPASMLPYTDIDGDKVVIKSTAGDLTGHATFSGGANGQLQLLDISDGTFKGASITVTVTQAGNGDGLAAVGRIHGGMNDLGSITIKGDLGDIDAGSGGAKPALKSLNVDSMGRYRLTTQVGGMGDLESDIHGALGALKVNGSVTDAFIKVFGGASAKLGSVTLGGSLIAGIIFSDGDMGAVKIGQDVRGGTANTSGSIVAGGKLASVTIGGSLIGGAGIGSGSVGGAVVGAVKIAHDMVAGNIDSAGTLAGVTIGGSLIGMDASTGKIQSTGDMGMVKIAHDMRGGAQPQSGAIISLAKLAGVTIGGSFIGGSLSNAGTIFSTGGMGMIKIAHGMTGGAGGSSASIESGGNLAGVTIGGTLAGGSGVLSGHIASGFLTGVGDLGPVKIGGDLLGGTNSGAGFIESAGKTAGVSITGSLIGGSQHDAGAIISTGDMGMVTIGRDFTGASISSGSLSDSGYIQGNRIAGVVIGGNVLAGTDNSGGGSLDGNASIRAVHDIGSIAIGSNVVGTVGMGGDVTQVVFSARDQTGGKNAAIGKITIGGRVEHAAILAGYDTMLMAKNGNAQIGKVKVAGDWIASDLIAGVQNGGAAGFGDAGDTIIAGGAGLAKIAGIVIGGLVKGTAVGGDQFGFESHTIGSFKADGIVIPVPAAPGFVTLAPDTAGDVTLRTI